MQLVVNTMGCVGKDEEIEVGRGVIGGSKMMGMCVRVCKKSE